MFVNYFHAPPSLTADTQRIPDWVDISGSLQAVKADNSHLAFPGIEQQPSIT
jgi:hypothetical protein